MFALCLAMFSVFGTIFGPILNVNYVMIKIFFEIASDYTVRIHSFQLFILLLIKKQQKPS